MTDVQTQLNRISELPNAGMRITQLRKLFQRQTRLQNVEKILPHISNKVIRDNLLLNVIRSPKFKPEDSIRLCDLIEDPKTRGLALYYVLQLLSTPEQAERVFQKFPKDSPLYNNALYYCFSVQPDLKKAQQIIRRMTDPHTVNKAKYALAITYSQLEPTQATRTKVRQLMQSITNDDFRDGALLDLSTSLHDQNQARSLIGMIRNDQIRNKAQTILSKKTSGKSQSQNR